MSLRPAWPLAFLVCAAAACGNGGIQIMDGGGDRGDTAQAGSGGTAGTGGAAGAAGTGGTAGAPGTAGTGGAAGRGGAGGAGGAPAPGADAGSGVACGNKSCEPQGRCCYACISLCAAPGQSCPVFIQDPCPRPDAGADAPRACNDKAATCPAGQVCDYNQPGRCAASTTSGVCIVKPMACSLVYAPVCGCDGKTYGNDCARQAAGAQLDHNGACN